VIETLWPWLTLAGLGAYHGINPAMGWLFAVALGLHRGRRSVILTALVPLALGHAGAIAITVALVAGLGLVIPSRSIELAAGGLLIAWGTYHALSRPRHNFRIGMRAGFAGLTTWSALMGLAHGAGLMLVPVLAEWPHTGAQAHGVLGGGGAGIARTLAGVGMHTLAMIAVTGGVALVIHDRVGVGILRRSWVNLDWIWAAALVVAGIILLVL